MTDTHRFGTRHGHPFIECLVCGKVSFHPEDIKQRYCGNCHSFHPITEESKSHDDTPKTTDMQTD